MVYMRILSSRCAVCVRHAFNYPDFAAKLSFVVIISTNRAKFETSWRGPVKIVSPKNIEPTSIYTYTSPHKTKQSLCMESLTHHAEKLFDIVAIELVAFSLLLVAPQALSNELARLALIIILRYHTVYINI